MNVICRWFFLQRNQNSRHFCSQFASYCNVNNWNSTNEKCYSNSEEVLICKTSKRSNWSCMKIIQRGWTYVIRIWARIAYLYVHSCNHHSTFSSSLLPPRSAVFFITKFTKWVYIKVSVPSIKFHQDFNKHQQQQQQKSERKVERTFSISITTKKAFARKKMMSCTRRRRRAQRRCKRAHKNGSKGELHHSRVSQRWVPRSSTWVEIDKHTKWRLWLVKNRSREFESGWKHPLRNGWAEAGEKWKKKWNPPR